LSDKVALLYKRFLKVE